MFDEVALLTGVAFSESGRSVAGMGVDFRDVDNDGLKDLFMGGSAILDNSEEIDRLPYLLPARVFRNLGPNGFADVSVAAGEALVSPRDACRRGLPQGLGRCGTSA
jgi:hypothetical protein